MSSSSSRPVPVGQPPTVATRRAVDAAAEVMASARPRYGAALLAHVTALIREPFPAACGVMVYLPFLHNGNRTLNLDSILFPGWNAENDENLFVIDKNADADALPECLREFTSATGLDWPQLLTETERRLTELAEVTGTEGWVWCSDTGALLAITFPTPPAGTTSGTTSRVGGGHAR